MDTDVYGVIKEMPISLIRKRPKVKVMATIHKLQESRNEDNSRYFLTLPKSVVEGLGWEKGTQIKIGLTTHHSVIKLLLEKA
tara:strand:+ start:235 stop:480 length:246 start_codon:yes stop_codon:yes gene_type:complete